jgi:hypothetical protein
LPLSEALTPSNNDCEGGQIECMAQEINHLQSIVGNLLSCLVENKILTLKDAAKTIGNFHKFEMVSEDE